MAGFAGGAAYIAFAGVVLDTDFRSFSPTEEMGVADVSAGADTNRTYVDLLKDGTATITILIQSADTTTWGAVALGTEGSLEWAQEGTAAGKPRHHANAIVTSRTPTYEYEGEVTADVGWQLSGAVTDTTY